MDIFSKIGHLFLISQIIHHKSYLLVLKHFYSKPSFLKLTLMTTNHWS